MLKEPKRIIAEEPTAQEYSLSDYSGAFVIIKYKMLDFSVLNISFNGFRNFTLCFFRTRLFGLRYLLQYK